MFEKPRSWMLWGFFVCGLTINQQKEKRGPKSPFWMFSQRNNPYCELLQILRCKNRHFSNNARTL